MTGVSIRASRRTVAGSLWVIVMMRVYGKLGYGIESTSMDYMPVEVDS
jgi:hypothetical protein